MAHFEVVGHDVDGNEILGEVMGDMDGEVMGARGRGRGRMMKIPPRPQWRNQLAPGVIQPDEGMVPLPMTSRARLQSLACSSAWSSRSRRR